MVDLSENRRQLMCSILYDIGAGLCAVAGHLKRALKESSKLSPHAVILLEYWEPRIEQWLRVQATLRNYCKSQTGAGPDFESLIAGLCDELAEIKTAQTQIQTLLGQTPEEPASYVSKMGGSRRSLENIRQSLLSGELKKYFDGSWNG